DHLEPSGPETGPKTSGPGQPSRMADAILLSILSLLGIATALTVAVSRVDWFYPSVVYLALLYFAADRFGWLE
ncbi:MAG: hypothetical protein AAB134_06545, partial [Pseudomonadota bacterium]